MRLFTRMRILSVLLTTLSISFSLSAFSQLTAGALSFDGSNDKVRVERSSGIGDTSLNNISDVITVEAWISPDANGTVTQNIISKSQRIPSSGQTGYILRTKDRWQTVTFMLKFNGVASWTEVTAAYPGLGAWHHVAATYDGTYMRLYIDGVMANQVIVAPDPTTNLSRTISVNSNPLFIGYQNGYTNEFYKGKMDELRIWNRVLSPCEIASNRSCELTNQNRLVAYYKFNQGLLGGVSNLLETTLKDASPNQNDGQLLDFGLLSSLSNWTDGAITNGVSCAPFAPPVVTIGSNSPSIAVGGTLELAASGGVSYSWTGPNGFTSNLQNPVITNITPSAAGLYAVTVTTASGCSAPASISIQVSNPARALNFDGDNDYVSIPHNNSLNPATGLTVEAWVYPTDAVTPSQSVVGKSSAQEQGYIFPRTDDGWRSFSFYVHLEGIGWNIISASYPSVNEWHHVAATYDGFTMKIYLDGDLKATKEIVGKLSSNQNPVTIGTQPGFSGEYFSGNVDEVRIWNRPLDKCEITNNISCELNPAIQNGLAAYYRFNNGLVGVNNTSINTLQDQSGNNNNGQLVDFSLNGVLSNWTSGNLGSGICAAFTPINGQVSVNGPILEVGSTIQLSASGGTSYSWTGPNNFTSNQQNPTIPNAQLINSGIYSVNVSDGGCSASIGTNLVVAYKAGTLDFDGTNDLVTVNHNSSLNINKNITMESWIYPTDGTRAVQNVMGNSTAAVNNGYIFPRTDDGWKTISFFLHLNGQWKILTTQFPGLNQWTHASATYDGYYMRIYLNGILAASTEASGDITTNTNNLVLGQQPGFVEYFKGKVEETKLWSRALNQCEIINNMNCELQPAQTGLVAYYKFNQGYVNAPNTTETRLVDASSNGNNGTLSNFAVNGLTSNWSDFKVNGTCSTYAEPPVTAESNASVFGIGSTIKLLANGGTTYTWNGPNAYSSTLPNPTIVNAQAVNTGTYTVAVPFINCTIFRSVRLTVTPLPAIQANGSTTICPSTNVQLSISTVGNSYKWYLNGEVIPNATSATYAASQTGSYTVGVTVNGTLQLSAPISVTVIDNQLPVPTVANLASLDGSTGVPITFRPTAIDNCAGTLTGTTTNPLTYTLPGTYTITWSYNDGNGNIASQTQQVVIVKSDVTPPAMTAPANVTVSCANIPAPATVTAIDDVDGAVAVTFSQVSTQDANNNNAAHYNYTITRTWTATDVSLNTASVSQTITVVDATAPVFGTVGTITVNAANNAAGANVNYNVTAVDGCGSPIAYTYNIVSGSFFAIGTTAVNVTARDVAGNTATASFNVVVVDNQAPTITAPANVTVNANVGTTYATGVVLGTATVTDNSSSGVAITNNALTQFPLGETIVTWTATDAAGNTASATQKVTVLDKEAPAITAPATVTTVTNNNQAFATNVNLGTATATDNSGSVTITDDRPTQFPIGTTTVTWTATDAAGNTVSATQLVIVEDKQAPVLNAPSNKVVATNAGVNYATGVDIGEASGTDNSGEPVTITNNKPANYQLGVNEVTWTITDKYGNSTQGVQLITVRDYEAPVITNATNIVVDAPVGSNTVVVPSLGNPTATDNVQLMSLTNNASGNVYSIGTTSILWTAVDAAGNVNTATQLVIVRDRTAPVLSAIPADVTVSCGNIPTAAAVTASDNYDKTVAVLFTEASTKGINPAQASFYNYTITRTWVARDVAGNETSASQTITVADNTAPVMTLPTNINVNNTAGTCGAIVNYTVSATDNCASPITYTYSKAAGTVFPIGETIVTVTAVDASGNNVSGSFTVTVTDNQAPTITAPANLNVTLGSAINLGTATATDNCGTPTITNNAPASYPLGVTVVTWTATDAAGNTASANQTVTVVAVTNCSSTITVTPENTTYTGGIPTNIYLGYGPQKVTLKANASGGTSYTYTWRVVSGNGTLSSTSSSQPVFAPTAAGTYTFEVSVRAQTGCVSTSTVTICVKDIRVIENDDDDNDCDHKSHASKDCKHKSHKHDCDHKSHNSKDCKDKHNHDNDDDDDCDHKSHSSKDCKHKDHKYHSSCDHKSHSSKDCKNKKSSDNNKKSNGSWSNSNWWSWSSNDDDDDCGDDDDDNDGSPKVYLCHVPPGNSGNTQTLRISVNAVEAHLRNHPGDKLGSCDQQGCSVTQNIATTTKVMQAGVTSETVSLIVAPKATQTAEVSDLTIKVMGNPSRNFFTIKMESKEELPVQIRVFDMNGRAVEAKANQLPNSTIQLGHNLQTGTFYAEFVQGNRRKVVQLIKVK